MRRVLPLSVSVLGPQSGVGAAPAITIQYLARQRGLQTARKLRPLIGSYCTLSLLFLSYASSGPEKDVFPSRDETARRLCVEVVSSPDMHGLFQVISTECGR